MDLPKIAGNSPLRIELEAGKRYAWCACGLSENQPFCNGAHKGKGMAPTVFVAEETKTVSLCTCKQTSNPNGFCDGTHKSI